MNKNYKFKLELNKTQINLLKEFEQISKEVWNAGVWQYTTHSDNYYFCTIKEKILNGLDLKSYEIMKLINITYKYKVKLKKEEINILNKELKSRLVAESEDRIKMSSFFSTICLELKLLTESDLSDLGIDKITIQNKNIDYPLKLKSYFNQKISKEKPSAYSQAKEIVQLKKTYSRLEKFSSLFIENTLQLLELSQKAFFKNLKNNPKLAGRPLFKREKDNAIIGFKSGFSILEVPYNSRNGYCKLATAQKDGFDLGILKYRQHLKFKGEVRTVSLKKEADSWYIVFSVKEDDYKLPKTGNVTAFDLGIVIPVMQVQKLNDSNNPVFTEHHFPPEILDMEKRVKVLQKRVRNKSTGDRRLGIAQSNNAKKAYQKIAKLQLKIKRAKDYHIKLMAYNIAKNNDIICIDDLKVRNMTKSAKGSVDSPGKNVKQKSGLNRSILSNNWGEIKSKVIQKSQEFGRKTVLVNPKNTSLTCSGCGHEDKENRLVQDEFKCTSCGFEINADKNASLNILNLGLKNKKVA